MVCTRKSNLKLSARLREPAPMLATCVGRFIFHAGRSSLLWVSAPPYNHHHQSSDAYCRTKALARIGHPIRTPFPCDLFCCFNALASFHRAGRNDQNLYLPLNVSLRQMRSFGGGKNEPRTNKFELKKNYEYAKSSPEGAKKQSSLKQISKLESSLKATNFAS